MTKGRLRAGGARLHIDHVRLHGRPIRYAVRPGNPGHTPLLIFNGIGANIELVEPFVAALSGPAVVVFDVPGVGGSPPPLLPYRPWHIARLAAALLDHLGLRQTDVLGVSWGGVIAQQFALQYRARCRRLILAATAPGVTMVPPGLRVMLNMATPRRYIDRGYAHRIAGSVYGGRFRHDTASVAETLRHVRFSSRRGYYLQLAAIAGWTSVPWLPLLTQPTLIMAGTDDPLVPAPNARLMQRLIPNARLESVDCGHLFLVTQAATSARIVGDFLAAGVEAVRAPQPGRRAFQPTEIREH